MINRLFALFPLLFGLSYHVLGQITYHNQIALIIDKYCIDCHYKAGPGPFELDHYEAVKSRSNFILHVIESRYMPPWKADPEFSHFRDERIMTDEDIQTIKSWVALGMPKGNPDKKEKRSPHKFKQRPDLVLSMNRTYTIEGNNEDDFRFFHIPTKINKDKFITGLEFLPGNKQRVHHSRIMVDTTNLIAGINGMSEKDTAVYAFQKKPLADEFLYGWVPGNFTFRFPRGFGRFIRKNSDIILNMHYSPSGIVETDQSRIHVYLSEPADIKREVKTFILRETDISNPPFVIPANTERTFYISSGTLPQDMSLLTIQPHAHLLAKSFRAFAITPDGDMIPLIKIDDWDFNWQMTYVFENLLVIPKGSVIIMEGVYDNTIHNPDNPVIPPKDVGYGWRTVDEMMNLIFYYVDYQAGDENLKLDYE
jgi:hypothetical protein